MATSQSPCQQYPNTKVNEVWKIFLETFFVNRRPNGKLLDIKKALAHWLQPLKQMAETEDWGENDNILVSYFVHTFHALRNAQEKHKADRFVVKYENWIYFNTGLITNNMEPIYAAFQKNYNKNAKGTDESPQYFLGWKEMGENFLKATHMAQYCYPFPERCRYFDNYTQLIMDGTQKTTVNWTHIIDENWDRIKCILAPQGKISTSKPVEAQKSEAHTLLEGALQKALNRVHANYRTAVPHSFKGELQLLLPLCILESNTPDLVLTISRVDSKPPQPGVFGYVAKTVLTLPMAYMNARLVARPEKDWLLAPKFCEENDEEYGNE